MSIPADSGGGGGGTPWYAYDVPTMWSLVKDQDTDALWKQVSGWKNTADLTLLHLSNLQEYREQLAEAWPPSRSQAAQAYLAELDKLITSVQDTNKAANDNYQAMVSIAGAAGDAKYKLKPLVDEYQSNQQKLDQYQEQVDSYKADTTAMPQPAPGPPPVPNGRQEVLNNQARSIMSGIGSEITLAAAAIKPPPRYIPPKPPGGKDDPSGTGSGSTGSGSGSGPVLIPPVVPPVVDAPSPTPLSSSHTSVPSTQTISPSTPAPIGQGPILGGTPGAPTAPPPSITPIGSGPIPTGPVSPGPFTPPVIGPASPGYGPGLKATLPGPNVIGSPPAGTPGLKSFSPTSGLGGPTGRAMPPGGVIGQRGATGLNQPAGGPKAMSRVNPPGGIIGQQSAGVRSAGGQQPAPAAGKGTGTRFGGSPGQKSGGYGLNGRPGQRSEEEETALHWDPDNPWETEEGVAPVVLPSEEPGRHDPGPAIGQGR